MRKRPSNASLTPSSSSSKVPKDSSSSKLTPSSGGAVRTSKSSEETDGDSAYVEFDGASPTSSHATSVASSLGPRRSPIGADSPHTGTQLRPPNSSKPTMAVKGITSPLSSHPKGGGLPRPSAVAKPSAIAKPPLTPKKNSVTSPTQAEKVDAGTKLNRKGAFKIKMQ